VWLPAKHRYYETSRGDRPTVLPLPHAAISGFAGQPRRWPTINHKDRRQAAPLRDGPGLVAKVGSPATRISRYVGSEGVTGQGQGSMSFSRRVSPHRPLPRFEARPPMRRDIRLRTLMSCGRPPPHYVR
jgi:hypothetical protein